MMSSRRWLCTFLLALAMLVQLPSIAVPWSAKRLPQINSVQKIDYVNICWWDNFSDPLLKQYIVQAIQNNHDARKASWQVEEYKQFVKYQFGQELPSLSVGATYAGVHLPDSVAKDFNKNILAVPFQANYEADIFLKNHDKTKSQKKAYESSKYQEKSVYISLAADVATVYLNVVKFDELISFQKDIIKTKKEILVREESKYQRGLVSATVVNDFKKDYETAKNNLNDYTKSRDKSLVQLAVLIGDSPENIKEYKRASLKTINFKTKVPTEISSDVIFSRPDILAAETNLEKSKIDVRVARKEFLPSINITGLYAMSTLGGANFFSWQSAIAAIMAGATQDLFTGGKKVANLKIYKSRYEQLFETYKQTDLIAIKEVKDSLLIINLDTKTDENTISKSKIELDNCHRACDRAARGIIPIQTMLTEKEQLLTVMQNRATTKTTRLIDYITLYKAVGGKL